MIFDARYLIVDIRHEKPKAEKITKLKAAESIKLKAQSPKKPLGV